MQRSGVRPSSAPLHSKPFAAVARERLFSSDSAKIGTDKELVVTERPIAHKALKFVAQGNTQRLYRLAERDRLAQVGARGVKATPMLGACCGWLPQSSSRVEGVFRLPGKQKPRLPVTASGAYTMSPPHLLRARHPTAQVASLHPKPEPYQKIAKRSIIFRPQCPVIRRDSIEGPVARHDFSRHDFSRPLGNPLCL